jgi:HlyD family secretion protein
MSLRLAGATDLVARPADADVDGFEEPSFRGIVICAAICIVCLLGGGFGWLLFARLDSAAIAPGVVIVDSQRKTVQHLEGGILRAVLVQEGETVITGQHLVLLDGTEAQARLDQLLAQQIAAEARLTRLRAEQGNLRALTFAPALLQAAARQGAEASIAAERDLFEARWQAHDSSIELITRRIEQLRNTIASLDAQLLANNKRLALYEDELDAVASLFRQGYERRPRLLELERQVADLTGRKGELINTIAANNQAIVGAEVEIENTRHVRMASVAGDLEQTLAIRADLAERVRAAQDVVDRRTVIAPQDGVVVDVRVVTPGGIIAPGEAIMDIVPVNDELIVESRVDPADIDVVREGLPAQVRLSAYKASTSPLIEGTVQYVSADMLTDQRTGNAYFLARVQLSPESLAEHTDMKPTPGMPASVMIVTGNRRAIDYFLGPITDRMRNSFREE